MEEKKIMIKADTRTMSVELEETVLDQLLEFSMIVQSLKESLRTKQSIIYKSSLMICVN